MNSFLRYFIHDLFGCTCLVDNGNEVFCKSEWDLMDWVSENIIHYKCVSINDFIAAIYNSFDLTASFFSVCLWLCFVFVLTLST